jgi:hypothetical protein
MSEADSPLRFLREFEDGTANILLWTPYLSDILHDVLVALPPPQRGLGEFRAWKETFFLPAISGSASALLKFNTQTLFVKVNEFYGINVRQKASAKRHGNRMSMPMRESTSQTSGNARASTELGTQQQQRKRSKPHDNDDDAGVVEQTGLVNCSDHLPYTTTIYTTNDGTKHFVAFLFVAPRCDVNPVVTVSDDIVTVDVSNITFTQADGAQIVNALKISDNEQAITEVLSAVQQIHPWRYRMTAPFRLDPSDVKFFRKPVRVGGSSSQSKHDVIIVDVAQLTSKRHNDVLLLE